MSQEQQEQVLQNSEPQSVNVTVNVSGDSRAERFLGTFDQISRLSLDIDRNYGNKRVVTDYPLKHDGSKWTGTINKLIVGFDYTITGHAYKCNDCENDNNEMQLSFQPSFNEILERHLAYPAQTFTTDSSITLSKIELELSQNKIQGTPNAKIEIGTTNVDGLPYNSIASSSEINSSQIPDISSGFQTFEFFFTDQISLQSNQKYYIRLINFVEPNGDPTITWRESSSSTDGDNPFINGDAYFLPDE